MNKLCGVTLLAFIASPVTAVAAPQSFYGKTIKVAWSETRSQRVQGEGEFRQQSVPMSLTVYVSSKGQLFRRVTSTSRKGQSGSKDRVGGGGSDAQGSAQISFQGNTLIATASNGGLGRRIQVTFDGGSSCSANVLTGKGGSGVQTVRSNATGKMLEFESVSAGSASCSVQDGNAFAD